MAGWRGGWLLLLGALLVGCGGGQYVPVADRSRPVKSQPPPAHYVVRKGDTLYSIAWRYGIDFRRIARLNAIDNDYRIYPGQKLRLKGQPVAAQAPKTQQKRTTQVAAAPVAPKVRNQSAPPQPNKNKPNTNTDSQKVSSTSSTTNSARVKSIRWRWPAEGRVIKTFTTRGKINKGINIAGRLGDPVFAAATGEVVYAGSGLLGYGNLIIINHDGLFMSAYAHNSRIFVKERDRVTQGDKIAEVGNSGTDRYMLHFEIRRDGQPVNPQRYLPKRK
ncbi:peptidoglycan DD-metalloendopeptidase family protein [Marinobacterium arenosum]|uniref:peptidoglycan DD-metalloendopeptidase family protein n=1 Tax=Marinobacterium arenosum TaxID=2862496 RepID=UPI001C97F1F5|nr:peptidoglycan DD-metalloendopeptidase family protein [Marinobacterium arenosum]MBY4675667.1 peptidoglycan DD-metalloendopeptidase family protein [Marinobacterium arenosum]